MGFPPSTDIVARTLAGPMGARLLAHDWSETSLGAPHEWPAALRHAVGMTLRSGFPMFVVWGPERTLIYNEAYKPILGAREPEALGRPFFAVWPEVASGVRPIIDTAYEGQSSFFEDREVVLERSGLPEQAWFTFSYSPLLDDAGEVAGALCVCIETTAAVLARDAAERERVRQQRMSEQEEQLRLATEASEVGLWDLHVGADDLFWPPRVKAMFGISPDQPISMADFYAGLHPDDRDATTQAFAAALDPARRALYDVEYRTIGKEDGQLRWVAAKGRAIFNERGECVRILGTALDITRRKLAEEHLHLMVNELNHRVKNSLATVQAITTQTLRHAEIPLDVRDTLTARLVALAQAHDVLTDERWSGADLREIAEQAAAPYGGIGADGPFDIDGPSLYLPPRTAIAIALAFHELATNAAKYGSLSMESGEVHIHWAVVHEPQGLRLRLTWTERGGPAPVRPSRTGFGTRLIERALAAELNGAVSLDYTASGVICTMDAVLAEEPKAAWEVDLQLT